MHDPLLRDNPEAAPEHRQETRPYFMQQPKYNMCHDDLPLVLERLRAVTDGYGDVMTVAEVGSPEPLPIMKDYTNGARRLNTAYGFEFLATHDLTAQYVRETLEGWPGEEDEGWPSWAFSNHDAMRVASRWLPDVEYDRRVRLIALLLFALRGNVFVYQGEELGLPQANVPFEKLKDPEGIKNWPHTMGRDGARTPMPWKHGEDYAGFSTVDPWLPVDTSHWSFAVDQQEGDPASALEFFKRLVALRRESPALRHGDLAFIDAPPDVIAFTRSADSEQLTCVVNLSNEARTWTPPAADEQSVLASVGADSSALLGTLPGHAGYLSNTNNG